MPAYIFLDESGDLSFDFTKGGVSSHFVITALFTKDSKAIDRCVTKTLRIVRHRHPKHRGCLHAYHEDPPTRRRLLSLLARTDCRVLVIQLAKRKVYTRLQDEKPVLYNYVANILLDRLVTGGLLGTEKVAHLIASRRETNKFLNANFQDYLGRQVRDNHGIVLDVSIRTPEEHKCLQAADMLSWAAFRKLEFGDGSYLELVREKVMESNLFP